LRGVVAASARGDRVDGPIDHSMNAKAALRVSLQTKAPGNVSRKALGHRHVGGKVTDNMARDEGGGLQVDSLAGQANRHARSAGAARAGP